MDVMCEIHLLRKFWWWTGWIFFSRWCQHWAENSDDARKSFQAAKVQKLMLENVKTKSKTTIVLAKGGHLGQRAQPAVHAVLVKQQARLVKLRIPPIFWLLLLLLLLFFFLFLRKLLRQSSESLLYLFSSLRPRSLVVRSCCPQPGFVWTSCCARTALQPHAQLILRWCR